MQPTQLMDDVLTGVAEQDDELDGLLAGLDEGGWGRPSRCAGWSIADVVLHLAQTDEMTVASAERRFDAVAAAFGNRAAPDGSTVEDLAGLAVAAERGRPGPGPRLLPRRRPPARPVRQRPRSHRLRRRRRAGPPPHLRLREWPPWTGPGCWRASRWWSSGCSPSCRRRPPSWPSGAPTWSR